MSDPIISVVVPTYNHSQYLGKAIQSVLLQTYKYLELIIIDNYSEDNTEEIVNSFIDKRIKYFKYRNYGVIASSRNFGIMKSQGEYISFLDSDDVWYPNKLEIVLSIFYKEIDIDVVCNNEYLRKNDKIVKILNYGPYPTNSMYENLLFRGCCLSPSATTLKKQIAIKVGGFSERKDFVTAEDYDFWIRLAKNGARFFHINKVLGEYVVHGQNMISRPDEHFWNLLNVLKEHEKEIPNSWKNRYKKSYGLAYRGYGRALLEHKRFSESVHLYALSLKHNFLVPKTWGGLILALCRISI